MGMRNLSREGTGTGGMTDAVAFVQFETGEFAMFSKMYKAYVLNENTGEVKESSVDELMEGDSIIFTKNNDDTKDIVDFILSEWISSGHASSDISDAYAKSKYWKEALIEYMHVTRQTPGMIAKKMIQNGVQVHEYTIRSWLDTDSHTVGPRKMESLQQIGLLIDDDEMFDNASLYFKACGDIRHLRRDILKSVGNAIINRISGNKQTESLLTHLISEKIDSISLVLKIESITPCSQNVSNNVVNRPILLKE